MRKIKKPKVPLLKAKLARELVESQKMQIHDLQEQLKSMTGARDNCKMMYEHGVKEVKDRDDAISLLKTRLVANARLVESLNAQSAKNDRQLAVYKNEGGLQLIGRGIKALALRAKNAAYNFYVRVILFPSK